MRLFIYEYTCANEKADSASQSLQTEGWAMLSAVLEDFARVPGIETVTLLGEHFEYQGKGVVRCTNRKPEEAVFHEQARAADYALVIAPEFDDILRTRCRWVEEAGGHLLGSSSGAVAIAADKLTCGQHFAENGLRTPRSWPVGRNVDLLDDLFPLVWKPRYGAGSQATFLLQGPKDWNKCSASAAAEGWAGEMMVQPFVAGLPASVAFLLGGPKAVALLPAAQHLSQDGRFRYLGGRLPLPPRLVERAVGLARPAVEWIPGLQGYVGVDLVLGDADDGSQDWIIEVNSRLTTSYVGLRALAEMNLAEALLKAVVGKELVEPRWRRASVQFAANGQVRILSTEY